jgi:hypothetical protein
MLNTPAMLRIFQGHDADAAFIEEAGAFVSFPGRRISSASGSAVRSTVRLNGHPARVIA